ncbi:hypothetical protein BDR07DRAFT_475625 [Suillus spraguei]|nr:hypothetical protein BDR07DRAFT_475625 [Suillus spraguei]
MAPPLLLRYLKKNFPLMGLGVRLCVSSIIGSVVMRSFTSVVSAQPIHVTGTYLPFQVLSRRSCHRVQESTRARAGGLHHGL